MSKPFTIDDIHNLAQSGKIRGYEVKAKRGITPTNSASTSLKAEEKGVITPEKKSKYGNKKVMWNGETFDSKRELARYQELKVMEDAGMITGLLRQVKYELIVNGEMVCRYIADHVYYENGVHVVEDVKGMRTKEYILKRKLMHAVFGITIREV